MQNPVKIIADMVQEAEKHADALSADRIRAMEYYRGVMKDTPSDEGRSKMVKRLVRSHIKKVLPSLIRTILGADEVVEFQPMEEGDEQGSQQASDYINFVVIDESDARNAIYDACHDALLLRNGLLKWWWDETPQVSGSYHTGLTDDAFAQLVGDDNVEVIEHTAREEITDQGPITVHDCRIRKTTTQGRVMAAAVPRERFLIHPDAVSLDDSLLTGEKLPMRRSDLVAMGYDRKLVDELPVGDDDDTEEIIRRDFVPGSDEAQRANDPIDYYDLYVRVDMDGDGIAELRHMCFAGGLGEKNLLVDEECDEVQFVDLCVMRQPHQWEGVSLADDLMDLQQGETVLLRQTLDNLYWQNNPQPWMQRGAVMNPDAVLNPEFGLAVELAQGVDGRTAYGFNTVPFVADKSFGMLEYMDNEAQERTGVTDASSGMAPDALQNMTAKASAMIEQAGIGQTEMMVRTLADGLKGFFKGMLRLIIRHQDVPRTVRLRGEWVPFDPRQWNAGMDAKVNTGLGAGTRERDMMMMQLVMGMQEKLLAAYGPNNPFVKPDNLWNSLAKMVESAGLKTPRMYFTEPDPQEIQALLESQANKPDPEMAKVQAQMQLEQAKMQMDAQKAQAQIQIDQNREQAQMDADLRVKQAEIAAEQQKQGDKLASEAALQDAKLSFERYKFDADLALRREEMTQRRQDEIWKAQAMAFEPKEAANGSN